ncbi:MAG: TetR/AcrR family transcriptional regulator [Pusillimonas sp.]|jgi:AcrR family transcriptional regulator|nr:TetR/AcrR family transcriptional regulator [Pusillimonas sp.]
MNSSFPRPHNRADLPEHIRRVANTLFQSNGYTQVTMEQIANLASVSKRTLYKYYPAKEALLEEVLEKTLASDLAKFDLQFYEGGSFRSTVTSVLQASALWCEQHTDYLLPYVRYKFITFEPNTDSKEDRGLLPFWTTLIATAQNRGELRANRAPVQLAVYFHYLYLAVLLRWLTTPELDLRNEFDAMASFFLEGASNNVIKN